MKSRKTTSTAHEKRRTDRKARAAMLFGFAITTAIATAGFYFLFIQPLRQSIEARDWVQVPCRIISAKVGVHDGSDSKTYSIDVVYQYDFEGRTYTSDRYRFGDGSSSGYGKKAAVVARLLETRETSCLVDPLNPAQAVLEREVDDLLFRLILPVVFMVIGSVGFYFAARWQPGKPKARPWLRQAKPDLRLAIESSAGGEVALKPSYWTAFLGTTVFAVIWNTIVLVVGLSQLSDGVMDWLMLMPFVLIGVFVVGLAFYYLIAVFNPHVRLILGCAQIPLGETVLLGWEFGEKSEMVRRLRLTLRGIESMTYRQNKNRHTLNNIFFETVVFETDDPGEIAAGEIGFAVPAESMHSFEVEGCSIRWEMHMHGTIRRRPDIKEKFPLTVIPAVQESCHE